MRRLALVLYIACAVLFSACSSGSRALPTPAPPPAPEKTAEVPAQTATTAAPAKLTVSDWNDKAFTAIKAQRWTEAEAAAREALKLDKENSAGWFNLGRALLGEERAEEAANAFSSAAGLSASKNADIEFYLAQAQEAAGRISLAAGRYESALQAFPGDKVIAAALEALKARYSPGPVPDWVGDFDGDGKPDRVLADSSRLTILSADGKALLNYTFDGLPNGQKLYPNVYRMDDGTQLVQVIYPACASAPQNAFFWYNRGTGSVIVDTKGFPCMFIDHKQESIFVGIYKEPPFMRFAQVQWSKTGWIAGAIEKTVLNFDVYPGQLPYVLTTVADARNRFADPTALFASAELYQSFATKTQTGHWSFAKSDDPLRLNATVDGKPHGTLTLTYEKNRITAMTWSE